MWGSDYVAILALRKNTFFGKMWATNRWLWARLPPQILPFLAFFSPVLWKKSGQKEMLQICPISLFTFLVKMTHKGPGTAVPSIF